MKHKKTLFSIFTISLLSLGIWIVIFFNTDPSKADKLAYITYISSLFLWVSGLITLLEYLIRIQLSKKELIYVPLATATRHGLMIALAISLLLGLQFLHILNLIDAIIIMIIITTGELYFKTRNYGKSSTKQN